MTGRESLMEARRLAVEIPVAFVLTTSPQEGHPNPEWTHRCDVTIAGKSLWSRWGRTAEDAEEGARWQIGVYLRRAFGG